MFYTNDRNKIRQFYLDAWDKHQTHQALTPLEKQIVDVVFLHPEYQKFLSLDQQTKDFSGQNNPANPFMHMGLHLAVRDQVNLDQPAGIKALYHSHLKQGINPHELEHQFMDILGEHLWQATMANKPLDMSSYFESLRQVFSKD